MMGLTLTLRGELIDPVMGISYNRNAGPALDTDHVLLVVDADVSVRTWSCSDPHLTRSAELLRAAWDMELLRLALEVGCGLVQTRMRGGVT